MLAKRFRLHSAQDFSQIYKIGNKSYSSGFLMFAMPNTSDNLQVGFVASKKVGNAVMRNRAKRLLREAFKSQIDQIKEGNTIVLIASPSIFNCNIDELRNQITNSLKKLNLTR